jgi:hypothetical protein
MIAGAGIFLVGVVVYFAGQIPGLGRLPGDLQFQRGTTSIYIPLGTMIVVSIVLTIILNIVVRLWR